ARQILFPVAFLCAFPAQAVTDGNLIRRQIAHEPQSSCSATWISPQIDNQAAATLKLRNGAVDLVRYIHANLAWETRHLDVSDVSRKNCRDDEPRAIDRVPFRFWQGYAQPNANLFSAQLLHLDVAEPSHSKGRHLRGDDWLSINLQ